MLLKLLLAWLQRTLNLFAWRIDFSSFVIYTAYLCMEFLCITTYGNFAAKEHFSLCCPFSCSVWPSLLAKQYLHVILRVMRGIGCKYSERELPKFFDCLDIIWYGWNIFADFYSMLRALNAIWVVMVLCCIYYYNLNGRLEFTLRT